MIGLAWLSCFLPTPSAPDGKPSKCVVREVQNRLKTQGLTANHLEDVVRQKEQAIENTENQYAHLGCAAGTRMDNDLNNGVEAKQQNEDLQAKRAEIVAKYQG